MAQPVRWRAGKQSVLRFLSARHRRRNRARRKNPTRVEKLPAPEKLLRPLAFSSARAEARSRLRSCAHRGSTRRTSLRKKSLPARR